MINLADEMDKILEKDYTFVLVRSTSDTKCNCWREGSNTPDPNHKRCGGTGYLYKEFVQKCIELTLSSTSQAHMQDFDYGKTYSNSRTIYFPINEKTLSIKAKDLVYEIEEKSRMIIRTSKWEVVDALAFKIDDNKPALVKILAKPLVV